MENYEEKYNKAIDVIKRIKEVNKGNAELVDFIEYNYPELAESEDEKIRKELIGALKQLDREKTPVDTYPYLEWIAWLEKQKSMKTVIEVWKEMRLEVYAQATGNRHEPNYADDGTKLFSLNDIDEIIEKISEKQGEQKPNMIQWTGNNLKEIISFTGKSPKFGEWFKSWDEYENYVHSHNDILKLFCEDGSHYEVPKGAWIVKTPDGYNIASRSKFIQKPVEWSEEDEWKFSDILALLRGGENYHYNTPELFAWLKSIKDRFIWKPSDEMLEALYRVTPENVMEKSEDEILLDKLYQGLKYGRVLSK